MENTTPTPEDTIDITEYTEENENHMGQLPVQRHHNTLATRESFSMVEVTEQLKMIQALFRSVMQENKHFGIIQGCGDKPVLLKPGAEKIGLMFRLSPTYEVTESEQTNNHKSFKIITTLTNINTGVVWGQGVGYATTMETKHWKYKDKPWDIYNTVIKMCKKRSYVDAIITSTAASDLFTQDIEDEDLGDLLTKSATTRPAPSTQPAQTQPPKTITENMTNELVRFSKSHITSPNEKTKIINLMENPTAPDAYNTAHTMLTYLYDKEKVIRFLENRIVNNNIMDQTLRNFSKKDLLEGAKEQITTKYIENNTRLAAIMETERLIFKTTNNQKTVEYTNE